MLVNKSKLFILFPLAKIVYIKEENQLFCVHSTVRLGSDQESRVARVVLCSLSPPGSI